jgi:hypothetical protein
VGQSAPMPSSDRPRDRNQLAKLIVDLATGETDEPQIPDDKRADRQAGGRAGGKARAAALTPEERQAIARKASRARWSKPERE